MGLIAREGTSPITDGEKIIAADVENDLATIFTEINGELDTANFARAANIVGTQFANTTIAGGKFEDDTITTASQNATAVHKTAFSRKKNDGTITDSATLVDVPELTTLTVTPGSTSDIVTMGLLVSLRQNSAQTLHIFGFNIDDGTGDVETGVCDFRYSSTIMHQTLLFQYTMTASAAVATVYTARYKRSAIVGSAYPKWEDTVGTVDYNTIFYVMATPIK